MAVDDALAAELVEEPDGGLLTIGFSKRKPAGQHGPARPPPFEVITGEHVAHRVVDLPDAVAPPEILGGVGVQQQVGARDSDGVQPAEPRNVPVSEAFLITGLAAIEDPASGEATSAPKGRPDEPVTKTVHAQSKDLVVTQQGIDAPAGTARFVLHPADQVDDPNAVRTTVEEVPEDGETGLVATPSTGGVEQSRLLKCPDEVLDVPVDVTDDMEHAMCLPFGQIQPLRPPGQRSNPPTGSEVYPCSVVGGPPPRTSAGSSVG